MSFFFFGQLYLSVVYYIILLYCRNKCKDQKKNNACYTIKTFSKAKKENKSLLMVGPTNNEEINKNKPYQSLI